MRLTHCTLTQFMGFAQVEVPLDHPMVIVVAENGSGKSSLLKGLRVAIGAYLLGIDDPDVRAPVIKPYMRRHTLSRVGYELVRAFPGDTTVAARARVGDSEISWSRTLKSRSRSRTDRGRANAIRDRARAGGEPFPLLAFYGARSRFPPSAAVPGRLEPGTRESAYGDALEGPIDFGERFARWRRLKHQAAESTEASAVYARLNQMLAGLLPGVQSVSYDTDHDAPIVQFAEYVSGGGLRAFSYLSDGFQSVLAIALDLGLRAIQLNPQLGVEVFQSIQGVVVIDEVGQHLHPSWQAAVTTGLRRAFPGVQFILSTHSPMVALGAPEDAAILRLSLDPTRPHAVVLPREALGPTYETALRSPAFEVATTWAPPIQKLFEARATMIREPHKNAQKLKENSAALGVFLDSVDSPEEPVQPQRPRPSREQVLALRQQMAKRLDPDS